MPEYDTPTSRIATQAKRGLLSKIDKQKLDGAIPFLVPDGVVGAPGLAFVLDTDTGLWRPATGQIAFSLDGTERMRVGETSPNNAAWKQLHVKGDIFVDRGDGTALIGPAQAAGIYLYYDGTNWRFGGAKVQSKNSVFFAEEHSPQWAAASAALTLTTTETDVPGATLTLATIGTYLIIGVFDFTILGTDTSQNMIGVLNANGVTQPGQAIYFSTTASARVTAIQVWSFATTAINQIVKLRGNKGGGTGTSQINLNTKIMAYRVVTN